MRPFLVLRFSYSFILFRWMSEISMSRFQFVACGLLTLSMPIVFVALTRQNNHVFALPTAEFDPRLAAASATAVGGTPKVSIQEDLSHDFGAGDPNLAYEYKFTIQNLGDAPLRLAKTGATSDDLALKIDPHTLLPG